MPDKGVEVQILSSALKIHFYTKRKRFPLAFFRIPIFVHTAVWCGQTTRSEEIWCGQNGHEQAPAPSTPPFKGTMTMAVWQKKWYSVRERQTRQADCERRSASRTSNRIRKTFYGTLKAPDGQRKQIPLTNDKASASA